MIPTIEQIVNDLLAGDITKVQALNWLYQHSEPVSSELRDGFAGFAIQGMLCEGYIPDQTIKFTDYQGQTHRLYAEQAYKIADAMMKARES